MISFPPSTPSAPSNYLLLLLRSFSFFSFLFLLLFLLYNLLCLLLLLFLLPFSAPFSLSFDPPFHSPPPSSSSSTSSPFFFFFFFSFFSLTPSPPPVVYSFVEYLVLEFTRKSMLTSTCDPVDISTALALSTTKHFKKCVVTSAAQ